MAEKLIALQDISDTLKTGDRFEAPDRILVAMGLAELDVESGSSEGDLPIDTASPPHAPAPRRRGRGRQHA